MTKTRTMDRIAAVLLLAFWLCLPQLGVFSAHNSAALLDEPSVLDGSTVHLSGAVRVPEPVQQTPPGAVSQWASPAGTVERHPSKKISIAPDHPSKHTKLYAIHRVLRI